MRGNKNTTTNTKPAPLAPVILCLVHRILLQRVSNLVNKLALLLHKYWGHMFSAFCMFFKYPSPDAKASPSPSRGEGSGLLRRYTPRNDVCSVGRSMVEMLGVLAIIAVLSVTGITGYSKAMEKYKMNKLMAEYNQLIFGLLEYNDDLQKNIEGEPFLTDFVISLNLMPNTWKKLNSQFLEDSQGNWLEIRYRQSDNYDINGHGLIIDFLLGGMTTDDSGKQKSENFAAKTCVELYNTILKPLHYSVVGTRVWGGNLNYFAGDRYCTEDYICLADATLSQIHEMCNSCDKTSRCNVTVFF